MSRLKSSVSLALAGCWLLLSTVAAQVVNIQLPEILGAFAGDTIGLGPLENITRNSAFANSAADCTGKFDDSTAGSIAFRTTDLLAENTTHVHPAYVVATVGNAPGSHRFTISCKAKSTNIEYLASGRIEVNSLSSQALYGFKNLSLHVDLSFQNNSRNLIKGIGYFPLSVGEANMKKLSSDFADDYFKNSLINPIRPVAFFDTDGVKPLPAFSFIAIQQGCLSAISHPFFSSAECVVVMKDNKTAVLFNYTGADGFMVPKLVKSAERALQNDDAFGFGGCFTVSKFGDGSIESQVFCWFFNPTTKKTKIVDTRVANKLADVEVNYRIVEQTPSETISSAICFLIDELQNKPYKVGCVSPMGGFANLSIFVELGQTATSSLNVTTRGNSTCTVAVTNLTGNIGPFRDMSGLATCNNSAFSGYITLDSDIPKAAGGYVLNMSAPLKVKDEVIRLPASTTATGFICKFENELAYFVNVNGNTEIHFQGTNSLNRGRILRTPLGLTGAVTIISTLCSKQQAAVILEHNSIRYIMTVAAPRDFAASLLTRIPIFEKISSTANAYDATDDIMSGFIYNSNQFGKTHQLSDVSIFLGVGYLLDIYNPAITVAGEYKTKLSQKPEYGQSTSFEAFLRLFDSSPQLGQRPGVTSMPTNVTDDLQKYYSLSGNFSSISIENSTVFAFTPLMATTALNTTAYPKGNRPIFVLGNEYLVNLQDRTFTSEKDGSTTTAISSPILANATFVGTLDNPTGFQMAVIASAPETSVQVVYFNNKSGKVEVSAPLNVSSNTVPGACFLSLNSKGEPSIAVMVKNPSDSSMTRYVNVRYQFDTTTGNLTTPSIEAVDHTFRKATTNSKAVDNYIVQIGPEESSKGALAVTCQVLSIIGNNVRSAMIYPVCALPEFPEVKHYILSANKTGNTLRLEVVATAAHPELGFGEVVSLEADIFDGANFRPNRDIVWKTTSLRKFQKFVGHVVSVQRKGDEEIILGLRRQPASILESSDSLPSTFVLSFFKADPITPYHQIEETNADFGSAFEYKNNWFISLFNTTSGEEKTAYVNYAPPTLRLLPGSTPETIAAQSIIFNKGTTREVKRAMRAIVPPPAPAPGPSPAPAASSSNTWVIVLVSIAVVGIIGGVAYYYFFQRRETIRRESDLNANNTSRITAEH